MKYEIRLRIMGIYNLLLAVGAIYTGIQMILGNGVFAEYPKEWLSKLPFNSWVPMGIIAIVIFGLGNIIAAILSFRKESNKPWLMSTIMGLIFFISIVTQRIVLGEWYMPTMQFFIFSILQLWLSRYIFLGYRKNQISPKL